MELEGSYQRELRPRAEIISLGVAGEDSAPTHIFPKLLELSETRELENHIRGAG